LNSSSLLLDFLPVSGEVLADTDSLKHLKSHVHVTLRKCAFLVEGDTSQADGLLGGPFRRFVCLENAPGNARSRGRDGERLLCENERLWWCEERGWGGCVTGDFNVKPSVDSSCKK